MFILNADYKTDRIDEWRDSWSRYYAYLESIKEELPSATYDYATADWHYNAHDPRSPHDAWVETINISEVAYKEDLQYRALQIDIRLLDAYHSGHIFFTYVDIASYSMKVPNVKDTILPVSANKGHHDRIADEVRLSERNLVLHEVEFALGARWLIECRELKYSWQPVD